jgi:hypothetical protein
MLANPIRNAAGGYGSATPMRGAMGGPAIGGVPAGGMGSVSQPTELVRNEPPRRSDPGEASNPHHDR